MKPAPRDVQSGRVFGISPSVWILTLACLYTLIARSALVLTPDYAHLLRGVEDDTYYYLQPAWNLIHKGMYSFDGIGKTYGFQPLWMLAVTLLARLSPDKEVLLRATLLLSVALYVVTGLVLYRLIKTEGKRAPAAVAVAVFWFANPWLSEVFTRGKENAIHALVLTLTALRARPVLERPLERSPIDWVILGALLGLMVLARVNNVLFVLTLVAIGVLRNGWSAYKGKAIPLTAAASLVTVAPWFIYAQLELGTAFPTSGSAKLKALRSDELISLVSLDSVGRIARSLAGVYRDVFPPVLIILILALFILWKESQGGLGLRLRAAGKGLVGWTRSEPTGLLFLVYALVNVSTTFVMLNPWFDYGIWYRVPEHCASVFLMSRAFLFLFKAPEEREEPSPRLAFWSASGVGLALASVLWALVFRRAVPAPDAPYRDWQDRIYLAVQAAPTIIPKGATVGAWNSGLVGYALDGYTVYNLDGLANTKEFLAVIGPNVAGLRLTPDHRDLARWLHENKVGYLIEFMDTANIGKQPCFRLIGFNHCQILRTAGEPMSFGPGHTIVESILELGPWDPPESKTTR